LKEADPGMKVSRSKDGKEGGKEGRRARAGG